MQQNEVLAVQELAHIRAMILHLEHVIHDNDTGQSTPVTSPDYWRARLEMVQAMGLPPALEPQARALSARLDALRATSCSRA
ncbi:hypothetical protein GCT13_39850 [Paraburkholderia sp. CNPSo 3157]|uniref:Uncharacterized protein n=1 Tax=Paraburkholderia franconis TaxID=2654983 RepID=A0A7X1NIY6_9BURK|nr:hypothetical protein [Paraburkholderia franconis]MPW22794.1 hypothetical protein [Paraburkholderia franconis]